MFMPLMVELRRALVFGGERGEGLQKTEKLALFADELLVVPESLPAPAWIDFPAGPIRHGGEALAFAAGRRVAVHPRPAGRRGLGRLLAGVDFVCSDLADAGLNRHIAAQCRRRGIRCNVIDNKELSDVWFMSLIDEPGLLAGLSSRGECAYASKAARLALRPAVARQGRIGRIYSQARAAYLAARGGGESAIGAAGRPGGAPAGAKSALAMLEGLDARPDFAAALAAGDWDGALALALAHAAACAGAAEAPNHETAP